ncbi:Rrp15p-domain-containing protein, partial [Catenaria anguillulae PL171]
MGKAKLSVSFAPKKSEREFAPAAPPAVASGSEAGSASDSDGDFAGMIEADNDSDDAVMDDEFSEDGESDDDEDVSMSEGEGEEDEEEDEDLPRLKKGKAAKKPTRPLNEAIADILSSKPRASATAPILSRTAIERKLEEEKIEEKARKILAREHKLDYSKEHVLPSAADLEYERKLRKVATRGVVKLFNAVRAAQHKVKVVKAKDASVIPSMDTKEKVVSTAKSTFMDILRRGNQPKTQSVLFNREPPSEEAESAAAEKKSNGDKQAASGSSSWGVLDDGFMMDAKLKDWEQEDEDEMEF